MDFVSVHGGHSGQFCSHAENSLEEIILAYIRHGYAWVGITEHVPGLAQRLLYTDQRKLGFTPETLRQRFARYMPECRRLQAKYADTITVFAAMESETYSGYAEHIEGLIAEFHPDYIVGSVHFVGDVNFDYSAAMYQEAVAQAGGIENLYCRYFDDQLAMIERLRPSVVGHFDLIRIFDPAYPVHLALPAVAERVERNLRRIKALDLIMDFNLRALYKGASEPYISRPILTRAKELGIAVVPGDDSHGVANIHENMERGIAILKELGFDMNWRRPRLIAYS
ncbi:MAG: histidinol-phosphatase [Desulfobulbaceae bacterium]|jgi:histidinol-phosphatase (PHP family)|nr:histidinol-phosphatase [Desulfobulbaceae bacterium]